MSFSSAAGTAIALRDPEAGPLDLDLGPDALGLGGDADPLDDRRPDRIGRWDRLAVVQRLAVGDLDAALAGLTYTPPPGYQGNPTLSLEAQSGGASPVDAQVPIVVTSGRFEVTTTADGGPGSLRQAILDSNLAAGGTNTIDFDIPGAGVQTIAPASPLPAITTPVVIDGTSQPGYAGTPLDRGPRPGDEDADALSAGVDLTVKGLAIGGCDLSAGRTLDHARPRVDPVPRGTRRPPSIIRSSPPRART